MTPLDIAFLSLAAVFTSAMTVVAGSGGGVVVIAILLQFMPPAAAIPVHGFVHVASNAWRTWLFRRDLAWRLIWRFALLLPAGIVVGLWLFQGMSKEMVQIIIGCFIIVTLFTRELGRFRGKELPLAAFIPLGFATGVLNMIVGAVMPVIGVLMIRRDLTKEAYVGTLGVYGTLSNFGKVVAFVYAGFSVVEYGPVILAMIPAVLLGTWLGKHLLGRLSERVFLIVFKTVLGALALKLILWDGAVKWIG